MRRLLAVALLLLAACGQERAQVAEPGVPGRAVWALDRETGRTLWRKEVDPPSAATDPVLVDGVVLVPSAGPLVAYDARSAERLWSVEGGPQVQVAGGLALLERDGVLQGVEPRTGRERWRVPLDGRRAYGGDGGVLLVGDGRREDLGASAPAGDTALTLLDLADGRARWTTGLEGLVDDADPGVGAVAVALRGLFAVLEPADGAVRVYTPTVVPVTEHRQVLVAGDRVLAASETVLHALAAADGRLLWDAPSAAGAAPLTVVGDAVLAAEPFGEAQVLGLADGAVRARREGHRDAALTRSGLVLGGAADVEARDPAGEVRWQAQAPTGERPYAQLDADDDVVVVVQSWGGPEPRD